LGRNDNIWDVIKDSHGNVWFSSFTYGFWRADAQGYLFPAKTYYNNRILSDQRLGYMSNCEDTQGRVYQTHSFGIAVYDPKQGDPNRLDFIHTGVSLAVYHDRDNGKTYMGGNVETYRTLAVLEPDGEVASYSSGHRHIVSISRDGNRKLRLGCFSGEAWFDEDNKTVVFDTLPRPYTGIISMDLDNQGVLWKGTTQGLFAEDRQGNNRQISTQPPNFVLHYRDKYIIWGYRDNLYLLDLAAYRQDSTVQIRTFGYYDGFDLMECGQNGASIDTEGYVWLAGGDKVIRFLPEQIMQVPLLQPTAPYLAAIYNANKDSEWRSVSLLRGTKQSSLFTGRFSGLLRRYASRNDVVFHMDTTISNASGWAPVQADAPLAFDRDDNYLRFDLLQASVSAPDKLVFRYRLNGYSEQWSETGDHTAVFQNLPFGRFVFEVQSSVDDGQQWSESVFSPVMIIRRPFLLSPVGFLLIFMGFVSLVIFVYYFTRKSIIRKEAEKQHVAQLKHRVVQSKFIPHFTGNVLNSINFLIAKNPALARKYISKFSDFSNQSMRISDKQYRSLQEELDYCQLYLELEKLRFEEKLTYTLSIDPSVDTQKLIPTMVLQTFCENAIKHGLFPKAEGGHITIRACLKADFTVVAVEDTGIGRARAEASRTQGTKEGLQIVQQQLELFNKNRPKNASMNIIDLFDEEGHPAGTCFELYIP
jgi:hypothetical protein